MIYSLYLLKLGSIIVLMFKLEFRSKIMVHVENKTTKPNHSWVRTTTTTTITPIKPDASLLWHQNEHHSSIRWYGYWSKFTSRADRQFIFSECVWVEIYLYPLIIKNYSPINEKKNGVWTWTHITRYFTKWIRVVFKCVYVEEIFICFNMFSLLLYFMGDRHILAVVRWHFKNVWFLFWLTHPLTPNVKIWRWIFDFIT